MTYNVFGGTLNPTLLYIQVGLLDRALNHFCIFRLYGAIRYLLHFTLGLLSLVGLALYLVD